MASRRQFIRACVQCGVEWTDNGTTLEVFAPLGWMFESTHTHMLTFTYDSGVTGAIPKWQAYDFLIEDMSMGICPCLAIDNGEDCDYCEGL